MATVAWIPVIFAVWSFALYYLSTNLPEHAGTDRSALKFPRNLEDLTALAGLLKDYKDDNFNYLMVLYCSAYLFKQTFAIPGSFFMNILGGTLFGIWKSFPLVCLLSACGASTCFMLSKLCGKAYIIKYFPEKVEYMQKKVTDNMDSLFFFLLFLRLFPMSPNWFLNMASPIFNVPVHLFFLSVFVGLMPYNFICIQTGSMLSEIDSIDDVFTTATTLKLIGIATAALLMVKHILFCALPGLMPYNFICIQTGSMLSEIDSIDDVFTTATTIKLIGIATAALLPGLLINKFKHGRLKLE